MIPTARTQSFTIDEIIREQRYQKDGPGATDDAAPTDVSTGRDDLQFEATGQSKPRTV